MVYIAEIRHSSTGTHGMSPGSQVVLASPGVRFRKHAICKQYKWHKCEIVGLIPLHTLVPDLLPSLVCLSTEKDKIEFLALFFWLYLFRRHFWIESMSFCKCCVALNKYLILLFIIITRPSGIWKSNGNIKAANIRKKAHIQKIKSNEKPELPKLFPWNLGISAWCLSGKCGSAKGATCLKIGIIGISYMYYIKDDIRLFELIIGFVHKIYSFLCTI